MSGRVLVVDSVSTNRIVLRVKLEHACYEVAQCSTLAEARAAVQRAMPKLIIAADNLPGITVSDLCTALREACAPAHVPIILTTCEHSIRARFDALQAGADEVLERPLNERLLIARMRGLIRDQNASLDLYVPQLARSDHGFAEAAAAFQAPARVEVVARDETLARQWAHTLGAFQGLRSRYSTPADSLKPRDPGAVPDVLVLVATDATELADLRVISEWRARVETRNAAIVAVLRGDDPRLAAEVFDLGGNELVAGHGRQQELALRIARQVRRKRIEDDLRARMRENAEAALVDPLTGLNNRRYGLAALKAVAHSSATDRSDYTVFFADLDHFKRINDTRGHGAGDQILCELASRLQTALRPSDTLARIGGEEFLMVLPRTGLRQARVIADTVWRRVNSTPFTVTEGDTSARVPVTVSIGVAVVNHKRRGASGGDTAGWALEAADRALYEAKSAGRNAIRFHEAPDAPRTPAQSRAKRLEICDIPPQGQFGTFNL